MAFLKGVRNKGYLRWLPDTSSDIRCFNETAHARIVLFFSHTLSLTVSLCLCTAVDKLSSCALDLAQASSVSSPSLAPADAATPKSLAAPLSESALAPAPHPSPSRRPHPHPRRHRQPCPCSSPRRRPPPTPAPYLCCRGYAHVAAELTRALYPFVDSACTDAK